MKNIKLLLSLLIIISQPIFAQKTANEGYFEGIVTYKLTPISYLAPEIAYQFPTKMELYIKGTKTRSEMTMGRLMQAEIADPNTKMSYTLLHIVDKGKNLDEKVVFKKTSQEREKERAKSPLPTLTYYDDSVKIILGYTCRKVVAYSKDPQWGTEYYANIWYTKAIGNHELNFNSIYPGLDGLLMEYEIYSVKSDLAVRYTVEKIEKKSVKDKEFKVPSKFKETTLTELLKKYSSSL